ncbi:MAG: pilin [Patescibacteria group bacterium]|nr:pilin [Patescibacteria group bacterium]
MIQKLGEKQIKVNLQIPGLTKKCDPDCNTSTCDYCVNNFGDYIIQFYQWFARAAGIFAAVMIVFAGFQWITASGNATKIEKAKATLNGALMGLVLTLGAFVLLNTINPALVRFKLLPLSNISKNVLDTFYCKDFPDKESIDSYPYFACGTRYDIPKSAQDKAAYGESYCCGSECDPTVETKSGEPKICANDVTSKKDCPLNCFDPKDLCDEADDEKCQEVDAVIAKNPEIKSSCRRINKGFGNMDCRFAKIRGTSSNGIFEVNLLQDELTEKVCEEVTDIRIDCERGGTQCWDSDNNEPRYLIAPSKIFCSSDSRANVEADTICCMKALKTEIDCRDPGKCDSKNEIEVDCDTYNSPEFNDMKYQGGGEDLACIDNNECFCPADHICCARTLSSLKFYLIISSNYSRNIFLYLNTANNLTI